ncbi:MAG: ATP-binding protein [Sulfuricella sp.]|jgi:two-component system osmolarity sensor histidine kinase EnvZ|nr:ATP-binding protein [Sulfuricella sp.]
MKRFTDSLYARLTLVLLVALGASFATMYWLFLSHLEDTRNNNFARSLAAQISLAEALLRTRPASGFPAIAGIRIARSAPAQPATLAAETARRLTFLEARLSEELRRKVEVVASREPVNGLWITLRAKPSEAPQWMFFPMPRPHTRLGDPLLRVLLVGFTVFFAGGMLLLWRIQRPLKRLGKALESVGQTNRLVALPVSGIGEIRILGERYNEMVERLRRHEEDRATMLAGVSHDLRAPITRLRLLVELAQGPRSGEMLRNLDDIGRITEQFLDYARGDNNEAPEQRDLSLFVEEVAAPYAAEGVSVIRSESDITLPLRASSLRRALVNLIENAIEYGGPPITIETFRAEGEAIIAVEDRGSGIDPDLISYALRPFSRLDHSRGGKGHCGLGLVIATRIAEQHHGRLELRNRAGGGLVAAIHLPGC